MSDEEKKVTETTQKDDGAKYKDLVQGHNFLKICEKAKPHNRFFTVDTEKKTLNWKSPRKTKKQTTILFDSIKEVVPGQTTNRFKKHRKGADEKEVKSSFSVLYGKKTVDLIAQDPETQERWVLGLKDLVHKAKAGDPIAKFLQSAWRQADKNGDGHLDINEITKLLHTLNVNFSKKVIKEKFDKASEETKGQLNFSEFAAFYKDIKYREEINHLFKEFAKGEKMTLSEFKTFLHDVQKCPLSDDDVRELIALNEIEFPDEELLSLDGFSHYLTSSASSIWLTEKLKIYQDMNQPLAHYWINSSHNTYLTGDQLKSKSSTQAYVNAFKLGCRCVELDCWDGPDGNPIVYHGHTLTSKILFEDIIKVVKQHAFEVSEYPIILSLEVHCTVPQQDRMAEIMTEILGNMIVTDPLPEGVNVLPSPEALKRRVIIKGKSLPKDVKPEEYDTDEEEDEDEDESEEAKKMKEEQGKKTGPPPKTKVSQKLSDLVTYCKTAGFKGFEEAKTKGKADYMSSFAEGKAVKLATNNRDDYIEYNRKQLSRIYPAGARVDSSNYDPTCHWNAGSQIVAFNFQTLDRTMQMNIGKFSENGGTGYILKPEYMRKDGGAKTSSKKLKLTVISAQQLPKPNQSTKGEVIDPYVQVEVSGEGETVVKKTKYIDDNGFNPVFNTEFEFDIVNPDVTLIRFVVYDKDVNSDDFIGSETVNFTAMGEGYRHVVLRDSKNNVLQLSTIFVKVEISN